MHASAVRIDAVTEWDVGRTILGHDGLRRIVKILDSPTSLLVQIFVVPFHVLEVRFPMDPFKPVWRIEMRAMTHEVGSEIVPGGRVTRLTAQANANPTQPVSHLGDSIKSLCGRGTCSLL